MPRGNPKLYGYSILIHFSIYPIHTNYNTLTHFYGKLNIFSITYIRGDENGVFSTMPQKTLPQIHITPNLDSLPCSICQWGLHPSLQFSPPDNPLHMSPQTRYSYFSSITFISCHPAFNVQVFLVADVHKLDKKKHFFRNKLLAPFYIFIYFGHSDNQRPI